MSLKEVGNNVQESQVSVIIFYLRSGHVFTFVGGSLKSDPSQTSATFYILHRCMLAKFFCKPWNNQGPIMEKRFALQVIQLKGKQK